mmetsp:Transcript_1143/g.3230  ORF Transcript_1143/g.3230 Transcript_1143/m.3230 type:complete len:107 (-) Transcript_1143:286-606(-)
MPKPSEAPYKKFIIKRAIPAAHEMTAVHLVKAACDSNKINEDQGCKCVWINSFVIKDGTVCIYAAADEEDVKSHAKCLTPDAPFELFEVFGTLDVSGAYPRQAKCE